jgi:cysteine desulfurase
MNTSAQIYLDNHASTQIDPRAVDAMMPYLYKEYGNPSSGHALGIRAEQAVQSARTSAMALLNARPNEIFFTSGATESNNLIIKGVFDHFRDQKPHFVVSAIEHKCILEACKFIALRGAEVTYLPVGSDGRVSASQVKAAIRANTVLVLVQHANNEIGSINAIADIGAACRELGVLFHTDAAQTLGKLPIDVEAMHLDFLSASAHKIYGPKGIGLIYMRKLSQPRVTPLLHGGGQESGVRSGTLNVPGIVGFGCALEIAASSMKEDLRHCLSLRNRLYRGLEARLSNVSLNGPAINLSGEKRDSGKSLDRLPNNLNIVLRDIELSALKRRVKSLIFSSGSACSSADQQPSYVLTAIGRSDIEAHSSLRFGVGRFTTGRDIDSAVDTLVQAVGELNPLTLKKGQTRSVY